MLSEFYTSLFNTLSSLGYPVSHGISRGLEGNYISIEHDEATDYDKFFESGDVSAPGNGASTGDCYYYTLDFKIHCFSDTSRSVALRIYEEVHDLLFKCEPFSISGYRIVKADLVERRFNSWNEEGFEYWASYRYYIGTGDV